MVGRLEHQVQVVSPSHTDKNFNKDVWKSEKKWHDKQRKTWELEEAVAFNS